jgi:hypothetical protein
MFVWMAIIRLGGAAAATAPNAGRIASSIGRANETPAPRRNDRRGSDRWADAKKTLMGSLLGWVGSGIRLRDYLLPIVCRFMLAGYRSA